MLRFYLYGLALFVLAANATGQVLDDTVPEEDIIILGWVPDEFMVFDKYEDLVFDKTVVTQAPSGYPHNGTVYVSTVFGANGKMKNTRIVKSVNPVFDSVAYLLTSNLKGWMPGMTRGRFVDIPYTFPVHFENDSLISREEIARSFSSYISAEEYQVRKILFDLLHDPDRPMNPDYSTFVNFVRHYFDDLCIRHYKHYHSSGFMPGVNIETNLQPERDRLILREGKGHRCLKDIEHPETLRLKKWREYLFIAYRPQENGKSEVAFYHTGAAHKGKITLSFKTLSIAEFVKELTKY